MSANEVSPATGVRISLAIITLNEERNIARCIESCSGAVDEVVVVDSGSRDRTVEIATALGARVVTHAFDDFGSQKNRALALATGDWVLNLDADEWPSEPMRRALRDVANGAPADCAGVGFPRHNRICGRWPRFGGWREGPKCRLWRRGLVSWAGTVHEWARVAEGFRTTTVPWPLLHDLGDDWQAYCEKQFSYAARQAAQMAQRGRRASPVDPALHGFSAAIRCAVVQGGVLDGAFGLRTAGHRAQAAYRKWRRLRSLGNRSPRVEH